MERYAVVHLMGHESRAGRIEHVEGKGGVFVYVPAVDYKGGYAYDDTGKIIGRQLMRQPAQKRFIGESAIYEIQYCTKEQAEKWARQNMIHGAVEHEETGVELYEEDKEADQPF